jgi:hypothetical protein
MIPSTGMACSPPAVRGGQSTTPVTSGIGTRIYFRNEPNEAHQAADCIYEENWRAIWDVQGVYDSLE